jgi:hypothetical protein
MHHVIVKIFAAGLAVLLVVAIIIFALIVTF